MEHSTTIVNVLTGKRTEIEVDKELWARFGEDANDIAIERYLESRCDE